MSKSNTTEHDVLAAFLKGTSPAWMANPNVYISLHTADPGEAGDQTTNETSYTNYASQPLTRASGWTDGGSTFTNANLIQFPQCGATGATTSFTSTASMTIGSLLNTGAAANKYNPFLPLAAGDTGVSDIDSLVWSGTAHASGTA